MVKYNTRQATIIYIANAGRNRSSHSSGSFSILQPELKRLEQDIGQQLLTRNTRGMSLTAAGEKLLSRCELLRNQVDLAFEELNHNKETPSGTFALTIPHACEKGIVIPALSQLCIEFPQIEPEIRVTDKAQDLIQNNLDVAIYGGELKDSNYRALPFGTVSEIFCATPAYVQKHGQLTKTDDLHKHHIIATSWQDGPLDIYKNDVPTEKFSVNCNFFAKTNTLPSALEMVLHNMGVALLPNLVIQLGFSSGRLVRVLPEYQGWQWPFYMVRRFHGEKPLHHIFRTHFFLIIELFLIP